eukprot:m.28102 g.28102  ORF g.28102 m.28102 type:complete len:244 (+) comp6015_c1_seq1:55-786(+)
MVWKGEGEEETTFPRWETFTSKYDYNNLDIEIIGRMDMDGKNGNQEKEEVKIASLKSNDYTSKTIMNNTTSGHEQPSSPLVSSTDVEDKGQFHRRARSKKRSCSRGENRIKGERETKSSTQAHANQHAVRPASRSRGENSCISMASCSCTKGPSTEEDNALGDILNRLLEEKKKQKSSRESSHRSYQRDLSPSLSSFSSSTPTSSCSLNSLSTTSYSITPTQRRATAIVLATNDCGEHNTPIN